MPPRPCGAVQKKIRIHRLPNERDGKRKKGPEERRSGGQTYRPRPERRKAARRGKKPPGEDHSVASRKKENRLFLLVRACRRGTGEGGKFIALRRQEELQNREKRGAGAACFTDYAGVRKGKGGGIYHRSSTGGAGRKGGAGFLCLHLLGGGGGGRKAVPGRPDEGNGGGVEGGPSPLLLQREEGGEWPYTSRGGKKMGKKDR